MSEEVTKEPVASMPADNARPIGKRWFVHANSQTYGPYFEGEIQRMVENSQILPSDLVCPEGGSAWTKAEDEPLLNALFQANPQGRARSTDLKTNSEAIARAADNTPISKTGRNFYRAMFQRPDQDQIRGDLREFFGPRAEKYLAVYEKMRVDNKPYARTFSWTVFLTTFPWYFYRRMYLAGALVIFVPLVLSYLFGITGNAGAMAGLAVTAKSQYVLSGLKRLQKADALGLVGEERKQYLRRAGGVSVTAGILAGLLCAAIFGLAILGVYLKRHRSAP